MVICGFVALAFADDSGEAGEEASESDPSYSVIYKMPTWVKKVQSFCPWQSKTDDLMKGHLRMVHGVFAEGDKLYVQWIKRLPNNGEETLATREIEELSKVTFRLKQLNPNIESEHCALVVEAENIKDRRPYRLELQFTEPGIYRYKQIAELATEL